MKSFSQLKKNLKNDFAALPKVKLAVLGDTATQLLTQAIRGWGYDQGLDIEVWEADFDQIALQINDSQSELYAFQPEFVVLFQSSHKLLSRYNKLRPEAQSSLASNELSSIESMTATLSEQLHCKIIYYNYTEIDDAVFGNYALQVASSFLFQLRKLNFELMHFATQQSNFYLCDLSTIQNQLGKTNFFPGSIYVNTEMVLSLEALPFVALRTVSIVESLLGKFKKCVILDLDNTTWGGIIGDDGIENIQIGSLGIGKAFTEFQYWIKKLKNRGIIVCVCSKNNESTAKEPFEKHPDMVLRLEDISVFVANWENKADNIRHIQSILNIGFDSMVFLDDNPFERNIIRENLPEVTVPELPEDPADYLEYLYTLNLFETVSHSGEDAERTKMYQVEAQRVQTQQKFTNEDDFLASLSMVSLVEPFTPFNTPRVAQLSQRSNQFNLRTVRYTEDDIKKMASSENHVTFTFTLEDKFGDNGLIGVVILQQEDNQTAFIDTWLMSCRVLKRTMENFVLNTVVAFCLDRGFMVLKGEYLPTAKNEMVAHHYPNLGFTQDGEKWSLNTAEYTPGKTFITKK
ncbi:HAD-IIIC family phosphatase [Flavobacterium sedimenticola]|uniref:HAD-IIIC family phosphatase n=1 Tax=Flavobacterium sedimenticola TaxID=3043286 RepID=A0ABT6XQI2_9FLAO|nr:HAD-IIIC family phosphatase [Flavobacterium sedimenticola]MDI9256924.1 HAD-IIIC family phosphatase [Flavobacterium sedimenticola]